MTEKTLRFSTKRELLMLPAPEDKYYEWYKHETQAGFYARVSKADAQGNIERIYFHRYKLEETVAGVTKKVEKRDALGPVLPGSKADFDEALRKLLERRRQLKKEQQEGVSTRLTVAGAFAFYATEKHTNKNATHEKDKQQYERYLSHLANKYLDELPYSFWAGFVTQLREGTLIVGQKKREDGGGMEPVLRGPLRPATLVGVLNTASLLYVIGNKHSGIHGEMKDANPPAKAKALIGSQNKRTSHIPLKDLGTAWRAADQLISPWWRDLFRVIVLTGLRRSLVFDMTFAEIDFERSLYLIHPLKKGTKRRGRDVTEATPLIRLPLSKYVLAILRAKREFADDKSGLVWHTPKPTRGVRSKKDKASLSDPRGAWSLIESTIGDYHFTPHDLRRTFASAGSASGADLFAVSMLMMHTGDELAKAANVPGITIKYVDTDEAVERARTAAEHITEYVLSLAKMPREAAQNIEDPVLPKNIEDALLESA
jgi:integrase